MNGVEGTEALIARIDERTALILDKLEDICHWRSDADRTLAEYRSSDLPKRMREVELFCRGLAAGLVLLAALIGWKMIVFPL